MCRWWPLPRLRIRCTSCSASSTLDDLALHTQAVVRDSGRQSRDEGWLGATHRWTVAGIEASRATVIAGLTYAWLPSHLVAEPTSSAGRLAPLPLAVGGVRKMPLYVVLVKGETAGPAARKALELLR